MNGMKTITIEQTTKITIDGERSPSARAEFEPVVDLRPLEDAMSVFGDALLDERWLDANFRRRPRVAGLWPEWELEIAQRREGQMKLLLVIGGTGTFAVGDGQTWLLSLQFWSAETRIFGMRLVRMVSSRLELQAVVDLLHAKSDGDVLSSLSDLSNRDLAGGS
ncbi:MAG: hypothetical protein ACKVT0_03410 [Planctomycetaceae bacterium]